MQTITTLTEAAEAIEANVTAEVHVNETSDTGLEVYLTGGADEPEDCYFIEATIDEETGETTGWEAREGWGDATYPGIIHRAEVSTHCLTLQSAADEAIRYLNNPTR